MSRPIERAHRLTAQTESTHLVVRDESGAELARLDAQRSALWLACNGQRSFAELANITSSQTGIPTSVDRVFDMLDEFADAGLLVSRVTPPGSPSLGRRGFLRTAALGVGLVAAGAASYATANSAIDQEQKLKQDAEQDVKKAAAKLAHDQEKLAHDQEREAKHQMHQEEKLKSGN